MKKEIICQECPCPYIIGTEIICDTCGTKLNLIYELGEDTVIELKFNGVDYDFCNWKCLLSFVLGELKKQNPETRFEYGREK
jgi:hypothetical protein